MAGSQSVSKPSVYKSQETAPNAYQRKWLQRRPPLSVVRHRGSLRLLQVFAASGRLIQVMSVLLDLEPL